MLYFVDISGDEWKTSDDGYNVVINFNRSILVTIPKIISFLVDCFKLESKKNIKKSYSWTDSHLVNIFFLTA